MAHEYDIVWERTREFFIATHESIEQYAKELSEHCEAEREKIREAVLSGNYSDATLRCRWSTYEANLQSLSTLSHILIMLEA